MKKAKFKPSPGKVIYMKSERVKVSNEPFSVPPRQFTIRYKKKPFLQFSGASLSAV